jgi:hypothetical protein
MEKVTLQGVWVRPLAAYYRLQCQNSLFSKAVAKMSDFCNTARPKMCYARQKSAIYDVDKKCAIYDVDKTGDLSSKSTGV